MSLNNLEITKRDISGTKCVKKLRHNGVTPGIIYGKGYEPVCIQMNSKVLSQICKTSSLTGQIFDVEIDNDKFKVISRDIEYNVVTDEPIHVDFQRISEDTTIKVSVPIEFINDDKSPGIKRGGVLNVVLHKVDCICKADSIPEKLQIDMTGCEIGESFHLDKISLPSDVSFAYKNDKIVVATIVMSKSVVNTSTTEE